MKKIDKGIPIPPTASGRKRKYPWFEMEVGDSFLHDSKNSNACSGAVASAQRITGFKFVTRKTSEGVRVWRVK